MVSKNKSAAAKANAQKRWGTSSDVSNLDTTNEPAQEDKLIEDESEDDFEITEESGFESSDDEDDEETERKSTFDILLGGKGDKSDAFFYQRGSNVSRKTVWRNKRKQGELEEEGKKQRKLNQFFQPKTPAPEPAPTAESEDTWQEKLENAISDLNKFLKSSAVKTLNSQDHQRHAAVLAFMNLQQQLHKKGRPGKRMRCRLSLQAAESYGRNKWYLEMIRKWERSWMDERNIAEGEQGRTTQNKESITAHKLAVAVTIYLRPDRAGEDMNDLIQRAIHISEASEEENQLWVRVRSVRRWLNNLGLNYSWVGKGVFKDGHEREDVVQYRQEKCLPKFMAYKNVSVRFREDKKMEKPDGVQAPVVFITQDDGSFNANDFPSHQWIAKDAPPIRPKGRGKGIMVSEFLTPAGRLCYEDEKGINRYATETLETGSGQWWKGENLVAQVKKAITIFKLSFPGCKGAWLFDNATGHSIFPPDALLPTAMNMNPGGKGTPFMRDGWYMMNDHQFTQKMNFEHGYPEHSGRPKGIKQVLRERGLWREGLTASCKTLKDKTQRTCTPFDDCCATNILAHQPDFMEQKCVIEEILSGEGQDVLFLPKFHCEFNWIEQFWVRARGVHGNIRLETSPA